MNKLAKILLVVLALALLTGTLAFAVMAETPDTGDSEVPEVILWTPPTEDDPETEVDETKPAYALWSSADGHYYENGDAPTQIFYENTISSSVTSTWKHPKATSHGIWSEQYVRLYQDCTLNMDLGYIVCAYVNMTFDLNNFKLTSGGIMKICSGSNYPGSLKFENGSLVNNHQFHFKEAQTLTFDNVIYTGSQLGYNSGGTLIIRDSEITLNHQCPIFLGPTSSDGDKILIESSDLIFTSSSLETNPEGIGDYGYDGIFQMMANGTTINMEIRIDGNSTLTATKVQNPLLFVIWQSVDYTNNYKLDFVIEKGAIFNGISTDLKYSYKSTDGTKEWAPAQNPKAPASIYVVEPDGTEAITEYEIKSFDNGDKLFYGQGVGGKVFTPGIDDTYAIWRCPEQYELGLLPRAYQTPELKASLTNSLADFAYVCLYKDIAYADDNNKTGIVGTGKSMTIDLNGNKLSSPSNMYIGSGNMQLTIKNGIFSPYQLHARENNRLHVIDVKWSSTYLAYFARAQEVIIENSVVNLTSYMAVELNYLPSATPAEFKLINSHIIVHGNVLSGIGPSNHHEGNAIIGIFYNYGTNIKWNVLFDKNSSVTYKGAGEAPNWLAVYSNIGNYPMDQLPNVVVEEGFKVSANCMPDFAYYVADKSDDSLYHFRRYERNDEVFSLRDAEGNAIANYHGVLTYEPDLDTYLYALTKTEAKPDLSDNFSANLTLFTDFKLNFFANGEVVDALYLNGIALESVDFEGKDKYVIDIPIYKAAEQLAITVSVKVGEEQHLYRTTYSVLKYANQIVSGNYAADAKELISAAMAYVQQAYIVTGAAAPEFEGVTVKARENDKTTVEYLTSAISGAQLNLDSGFRFRFNLKSDYTGTLVIGNSSFEVSEGKVGELTYVEVNLRAYQLADEFSVTAGGESVTYSLAAYAKSVNDDLVNALYTYCVIAGEYKANNQ